MTYELTRLEKDESSGNLLIVVTSYIGDNKYPIMKWISPSEPTHAEDVGLCEQRLADTLAGKDKQKFNNMIKGLHEENVRALVGAKHLDKITKLPI